MKMLCSNLFRSLLCGGLLAAAIVLSGVSAFAQAPPSNAIAAKRLLPTAAERALVDPYRASCAELAAVDSKWDSVE